MRLLGVMFLGTHCVQSDAPDNRIKQEGVMVWLRLLLSLTPLRKVQKVQFWGTLESASKIWVQMRYTHCELSGWMSP